MNDQNIIDVIAANAGVNLKTIYFSKKRQTITLEGERLPGYVIDKAVKMGLEDELNLDYQNVLSTAWKLIQGVSGTEIEKAIQIHDILCKHIIYTIDDTTDIDDCCIGAILNGRANCDGYADAFFLCASLCGLKVKYIHGDSLLKDPENNSTHLWNLIFLDGTWRSLDLTWDDRENELFTYIYFNIGLDRMDKAYDFNHELLPKPFANTTDLAQRPVREFYAEDIQTPRQLSEAVQEGVKQGCRNFYLCLSDALYEEMMEHTSLLSRAVMDGGFADSWSYYHWDDQRSVYIVGDGEEGSRE